MIVVPNVNGKPEYTPKGKFVGIHNDNINYYYCETEQELAPYLPSDNIPHEKEDPSNIDVDKFTQDQIMKLKARLDSATK